MKRVYFIKPIGMDGPIKIGCSRSPYKRLDSLELWSPFRLELLTDIAGDGPLERQFHAMFAEDHIHHEWFAWSPRLEWTIQSIKRGAFNLASLPDPAHLPRRERDTSYTTPAWRYERSVASRLRFIHDRCGLGWNEFKKLTEVIPTRIDRLSEAEIASLKPTIEAKIAELTALFPATGHRAARRRKAAA